MSTQSKIPVIIDTDPGVDDALALKIAFGSPLLDVRLVCSVAGNVPIEFTTANALYLTKKYGGDIPVAKGDAGPLAGRPTDASNVHGLRGIGDYVIPPHAYALTAQDGVRAMRDALTAANEKITLITLGPLTNVARLLKTYPETKQNIERIVAMIGSVDGTGNKTAYAEFNAYCDPGALDTVIRAGLTIVFAPMHLGRDTKLAQADILERDSGSDFGKMLPAVFRGYRDDAVDEGYVAMYDANAVEALLHPEYYDFIPCRAEVDVARRAGQTHLYADASGPFFYLEVKNRPALAEAMLNDMFAPPPKASA